MIHVFVTPDGEIARRQDFGDELPPILAPNKGRWLPDLPPPWLVGLQFPPSPIEPVPKDAAQLLYAAPQPIPLEELRRAKQLEIDAEFERLARELTAGYPAHEIATWPAQQIEALAWRNDAAAATPFIDGLAAARGVGREDLLRRCLAKIDLFYAASSALVGKRQGLEDRVQMAAAVEIPLISW